ncbi:MAG: hypothetical protein MUE91_11985 [Ignavibacteriaceae bacterium]|jgi:hypothetical protein|nr:hypothetical protein [Ignavibacteriaceae bacterium]MCU0407279.1 hypothetical protein [Ignavibacteriaceae bacterium]MCU0415098.1 hypothetical protein [Ignavibacteriaceae bacterium]
MKPPSQLDSARVLYWAWSGDKPFGNISADLSSAIDIFGFAICIMDGELYRFSCDRNWKVQNDMDFESIEEAMMASYPQYQNQPIQWKKFDDTDIDALMSENQMIKFYQEVGARRVIQKIFDHLRKHKCTGMSVQSIAKDVWLLSILKKDIHIASEIAKSNVKGNLDSQNK